MGSNPAGREETASVLARRYPTAFVTGAAGGLGRAFVDMLLADGVRVWGTARDEARLSELRARPGFTPVILDLARPSEAQAAFEKAADHVGPGGAFDLVINNAGYGLFSRFVECRFDLWQAQLEAMLTTTLRISQAALTRLQARQPLQGALVNVSSLAVDFPIPCMSGYNVAKAGLSAFSESLLFEMRGTGVTVIDFRPGDYQTSFNQAMHVTAALPPDDARLAAIWRTLEANMQASPRPERAAADLRRALLRGRSGVVRSGGFFQARLAPFLNRIAPQRLRRAMMARYFGME